MKKRLFVILFTIMLVVTACTSKINSEDLMKDISSNDVPEGPCPGVVSGSDVSDFAVRLLHTMDAGEENTLISPISILCAMGMAANGADEETLEQMEAVLGVSTQMLNNYIYGYRKVLPQSEHCKVYLANSIWVKQEPNFEVKTTFLQLNADYYGADMYQTPFDDSTVKDINNWVKKETNGMIPEILDEISKEAVMYLVNALAFEAEWGEVYKKSQVRNDIFTTENGTEQTVEFMYSNEGRYFENKNAKGFLKYYKDSNYAFVAILPNEDMSVSDYIASLDGEELDALLAGRQQTSVKTAIPKFETEYGTELSKVLRQMGMSNAFDEDDSDFSELGTCKDGNIYMNRVIHKTFISVGEKGTRAGAATAVEMNSKGTAAMVEEKIVYLNRPFVYMLIDCDTNVPFFIGTMMDVKQ